MKFKIIKQLKWFSDLLESKDIRWRQFAWNDEGWNRFSLHVPPLKTVSKHLYGGVKGPLYFRKDLIRLGKVINKDLKT